MKIKVFGIVEKFEVDAYLNFNVLLADEKPMSLPFIILFRRESGTSQGMAELEKPMFCHRL